MTDESTTPDTAPESDSDALAAPAATPGPSGEEGGAESRRDARYRERLRAAEAKRDRYRVAFEPHARAAIERAVGDRLTDASSIWLLPDADPLGMLDDELGVDVERVKAAIDTLLAHAPTLARRNGTADGGARSTGPIGPSATWGGLLSRQQ